MTNVSNRSYCLVRMQLHREIILEILVFGGIEHPTTELQVNNVSFLKRLISLIFIACYVIIN